jgi:hypothetical protein
MDTLAMECIEREVELPFARDSDRLRGGPVTATPEEIRYAETLRERLREMYLRHAPAEPPPWCVGAD